jgi:hypothetical protein
MSPERQFWSVQMLRGPCVHGHVVYAYDVSPVLALLRRRVTTSTSVTRYDLDKRYALRPRQALRRRRVTTSTSVTPPLRYYLHKFTAGHITFHVKKRQKWFPCFAVSNVQKQFCKLQWSDRGKPQRELYIQTAQHTMCSNGVAMVYRFAQCIWMAVITITHITAVWW